MIDAHFHLDFFPSEEWPALVSAARARGVRGGVLAGVWNDQARALDAWIRSPGHVAPCLAVATRSDPLRAADDATFLVHLAHGLHPAEVARRCASPPASGEGDSRRPEERLEEAIATFEGLLEEHAPHVRAIGETGFDAHPWIAAEAAAWGLDKKGLLALQDRAFNACVGAAVRRGLPLIVHSRGAWEHTLASVRAARKRGVGRIMFHCYGGPAQDAPRLAREGFSLSFGGVPTWERARRVRDAFLACPLEALLVETDGPDLPLEFEDGRRPARHDPAHLSDVAARLAAIRGISVGELTAACDGNLGCFLIGG